jgi:hypothetical protein
MKRFFGNHGQCAFDPPLRRIEVMPLLEGVRSYRSTWCSARRRSRTSSAGRTILDAKVMYVKNVQMEEEEGGSTLC